MHSRASQALAKAFHENRGAQTRLAGRTGISPTRLSRLAQGETEPNVGNSLKLKDDPEIPIDPAWWGEPPLPEGADSQTGAGG